MIFAIVGIALLAALVYFVAVQPEKPARDLPEAWLSAAKYGEKSANKAEKRGDMESAQKYREHAADAKKMAESLVARSE